MKPFSKLVVARVNRDRRLVTNVGKAGMQALVRTLVAMSFLATVGGRYSTPSRAPCAFAALDIAPFSRCRTQILTHSHGTAHARAGRVPSMMLRGGSDGDGWRLSGARFSESFHAEQARAGWLRGGLAAPALMSRVGALRGAGARRGGGGGAGALEQGDEGAASVRKVPRALTPEEIKLAQQFISPELAANVCFQTHSV